jgi:hypothetical protein
VVLTADGSGLSEGFSDSRIQLEALICSLTVSVGVDLSLDPGGEGVTSETVEEVAYVSKGDKGQ